MANNLPPGVSESDLPGNRPEDLEWERLHEFIDQECDRLSLSPEGAKEIWKLGVRHSKTSEPKTLAELSRSRRAR